MAEFSPDATKLAIASNDSVEVLELNTKTFTVLSDDVYVASNIDEIGFSGDSNQLIGLSGDGGIRIWDLKTGQLLTAPEVPYLNTASLDFDGTQMAIGTVTGLVD